jgi:hypothetical protein
LPTKCVVKRPHVQCQVRQPAVVVDGKNSNAPPLTSPSPGVHSSHSRWGYSRTPKIKGSQKMKRNIVFGAAALLAGSVLAADSTPKDQIMTAARKLADKANYSWKTTFVVPEGSQFRRGRRPDGKGRLHPPAHELR